MSARWVLTICVVVVVSGCLGGPIYLPQGYLMSPLHPVAQETKQLDLHLAAGYLQDYESENQGAYVQIGGTFSSLGRWLLFQGQVNAGYGGVSQFSWGPYGNFTLLGGLAAGHKTRFHLGLWAGGFVQYYMSSSQARNAADVIAYPLLGPYVGLSWTTAKEGKIPWSGMIRWLPGLGGGLQFAYARGPFQIMAGFPLMMGISALQYPRMPPFQIGIAWQLSEK